MLKAMQKCAGLNEINRSFINQQFRIFSQRFQGDTAKLEKSWNKVQLLGRVGNDPQKRGSVENPVVTFSLATASNYKSGTGELLKKTEWHKVVIFSHSLGNVVANVLTKGSRVLINGRLSYNEIKDQEGIQKSVANIIADEVVFLQIRDSTESQRENNDDL